VGPAACFGPGLASIVEARRFVQSFCQGWAAPERVEVAALLTSELVTNAVVHARSPATVVLTRTDEELRVAVSDEGGGVPAVDRSGGTGEGGRGLALVEELSASWGVLPLGTGKTVWFTLRLGPARA
jgi:anti-sigma regulatory factor (Ser/Thr protein kinase)